MKFKSSMSFIIKLIVGVSIFLFVLYKIGLPNILNTLGDMNLLFLPIIIVVNILIFLLGSLNYSILIIPFKKKTSVWRMFKDYLVSVAIASFIPGKIGELSMVFFLKKEGIDLGKSTSLVILDKIITISILTIFGALGYFVFLNLTNAFRMLIVIITIILIIYFALSKMGLSFIKKFIFRKYSGRFKGFSKTLSYFFRREKKLIAINVFLTTIKFLFSAILFYFLFLSFNVEVNIFNIFIINILATIASFIPITISGLGIREGASVYFYNLIGIPSQISLSVLLIFLVLKYLQTLLVFALFLNKKDFEEIRRELKTNDTNT